MHRVHIASPRGVAAYDGHVFLLSQTKLLRLHRDGTVAAVVISSGLQDPIGLAIDGKGNFYITDRSTAELHWCGLMNPPADSNFPNRGGAQQVKVFSPQGQLLRTIGQTGGRPRNGPYDPKGMLDPRGVCIGPGGAVWVASPAEDYQRISVWNAATGALEQEFFNTRISSGQGELTPDYRQMLVCNGDYADSPSLTAYNLNLKKGTWYPAWNDNIAINEMTQPQVLRGNNHIFGILVKPFDDQSPYLSFAGGMVKADNGKTYLCGGSCSIWLFNHKTDRPKLASVVYMHRVQKLGAGRYQGLYDQGPDNWFTWSDVKGNGQMSAAGVRFTARPPGMSKISRPFGWAVEPNLSIRMLCPVDQGRLANGQSRPFQWVIKELAPRKILSNGVPIYDWRDVKTLTVLHVPSSVGGDGWKGGASTALLDFNTGGGGYNCWSQPRWGANLMLPGIDGDGWWASRNWRNSPLRFNDAGIPAWIKLGRRAAGLAKPGEMYYPWTVETDINGFCYVADAISQTWVWTDQGLYIGHLYHDPTKQIRDGNSVFVESVGGATYKIHGRVYNFMGDHGVFVHQVITPKLTPVTGGTVVVTAAMAAAAKPWDPDGPMPGKRPAYVAHSIWNFFAQRYGTPQQAHGNLHTRTITIDGQLTRAEWGGVKPMLIKRNGQVVAKVKAVFGQSHLYLAYDVINPDGFKNAGTELPACPFTSGSYVDFCIARNWSNPNRSKNVAGDVRVILARITSGQRSHKYQMAFWPVRSKRNAVHPQTIISPAARRHFDDIAPLPGLRWAYRLNPKGYTVEVSVPLGALGIYHAAQPIGFDASVGFANLAGTVREAADHWDGQTEAMVVDRPGSAALQPDTWGTLIFDRSPALGPVPAGH